MAVSHFFFFFSSRRRHTRSLCDWSSDVCSSDLETPTKEGRPATGWDLIGYAAGRATKPWFAIGGMDPATARAAAAAGAQRVVVVRAIRDADDPEAAARAVRAALDAEARVGAAQEEEK